jgi:spermidine synthase
MLAAERMYGKHARIGVVGLGVGTLACYHRPGQQHTFFEIDPTVLAYSRKGTFTYLSHCAPDARVEIGDARLNLAKAAPGSFDILAIDAFSSDSIPLHLLTAEAQAVYFRALAPEGMLLVHTTNRFVDLEPVVAALARRNGLSAAIRDDWPKDKWPQTRSFWIVLTRQPQTLARLQGEGHDWKPLAAPAGAIWTDDYASILPHMKWHAFF